MTVSCAQRPQKDKILIIVASNFAKNQNTLAPYLAPTFYTGGKIVLGERRAVLVYHLNESALWFVEYLSIAMSRTCSASIPIMQGFSSYMSLPSYGPKDWKKALEAWSGGCQCTIFQNVQKSFLRSDSVPQEPLLGSTLSATTPPTTQKHGRRFLESNIERKISL